jgi:hypothetical protein
MSFSSLRRKVAAVRYRGRHRAHRFSTDVYELIADCKRIPIAELFAMQRTAWEGR